VTSRAYRTEIRLPGLLLSLGAVLLCALPAMYLNSAFGWLPVLTLVFMWLLSFIYVKILARGIEISGESLFGSCTRGAETDFRVTLKSASRLPCPDAEISLFVSDAIGDVAAQSAVRTAILPGEERELGFSVSFKHVGEYRVGIKSVRLRGFFGGFRVVIRNAGEYGVTVIPKSHALGKFALSDMVRSESLRAYTRSSAESVDYAGVRDYAFGDPIKLIHWKLSSHSDRYMTKLLESYGSNGITVVPYMLSPEYDAETLMGVYDALVETCFSICRHASDSGLDTELVFIGRDGGKTSALPSGTGGFASVMRSMPKIHTAYDSLTDDIGYLFDGGGIYSHSNIAVCAATLDDGLVQTLLRLRRARKNPILFFTLPDCVYGDDRRLASKPLALLERAGVPYFVIPSADDIERTVG
jgi:uncharacterized protein (DUF58 family)